MAKIEKLQEVVTLLQAKAAAMQAGGRASVIVGFTQAYAIHVHENLEAHHPVGQAKFLEQPARQLRGKIGDMVAQALRAGKTMAQALLLVGLRLQRDSQKLVPVDTGALKNSAFTRLEAE